MLYIWLQKNGSYFIFFEEYIYKQVLFALTNILTHIYKKKRGDVKKGGGCWDYKNKESMKCKAKCLINNQSQREHKSEKREKKKGGGVPRKKIYI